MTESPFVEGTTIQFAWDSTSLGYLKTCPRLYYYTVIEGWESKEESVHLKFGIEFHHAMQMYDLSRARGIKHDDAVFDVVRDTLLRTIDFVSDHPKKNRESLIRGIVWYLDSHKEDPGETYLLSNGDPAVEQSFQWHLDYGPAEGYEYVLCGHLDRVVKYMGATYVMDYKTVWSTWGQVWEPDNQMTLYTLASKVVLQAPVQGVIIDMMTFKTKEGEVYPAFERAITQRTPDQTEEWLGDLGLWFSQAEDYAKENYWPMNDTSCGKYGGCRFRDICSKSPSVRKTFLESNFKRQTLEERWNPLKPR